MRDFVVKQEGTGFSVYPLPNDVAESTPQPLQSPLSRNPPHVSRAPGPPVEIRILELNGSLDQVLEDSIETKRKIAAATSTRRPEQS